MIGSYILPPPIDGLNLRDSPYFIKQTEATRLDNYKIFDWGIREVGYSSAGTNPVGSSPIRQIVYFKTPSGTLSHLVCGNNKVYLVTSNTFGSATNKTGALTITSSYWVPCFFNKKIFLFNKTDVGLIYDISGATLANDSLTGPSPNSSVLSQGWNYKQRLYAIEGLTTKYWYLPGIGDISGAMSSEDIGDYFKLFGTLLFGTSWSNNSGLTNEEYMVLVTTEGEVFVYSGDYPGADNWQLVTRVQIPLPLGNQSYIHTGQDILIVTALGVISLSAVISTRSDDQRYYNISSKLGQSFGSVDIRPIKDPLAPFIYFAAATSDYIYCLNYERGAWSRILTGVSGGTITGISYYDGALAGSAPGTPPPAPSTGGSALIVTYSDNSIYEYVDGIANSKTHRWDTGFLPIEPNKQKQLDHVRVFGSLYGGTTFTTAVGCYFDAYSSAVGSDNKTTTPGSSDYVYLDLYPTGVGKRPLLSFSKTSDNESNVISGVEIFYTTGGVL